MFIQVQRTDGSWHPAEVIHRRRNDQGPWQLNFLLYLALWSKVLLNCSLKQLLRVTVTQVTE